MCVYIWITWITIEVVIFRDSDVYTYVYTYVKKCTSMRIQVCIHMDNWDYNRGRDILTLRRIHVCMHVCKRIHACVYMCVYIWITGITIKIVIFQ